jgi:FtsZ-binding cell division protein ZapB
MKQQIVDSEGDEEEELTQSVQNMLKNEQPQELLSDRIVTPVPPRPVLYKDQEEKLLIEEEQISPAVDLVCDSVTSTSSVTSTAASPGMNSPEPETLAIPEASTLSDEANSSSNSIRIHQMEEILKLDSELVDGLKKQNETLHYELQRVKVERDAIARDVETVQRDAEEWRLQLDQLKRHLGDLQREKDMARSQISLLQRQLLDKQDSRSPVVTREERSDAYHPMHPAVSVESNAGEVFVYLEERRISLTDYVLSLETDEE